MKKNPLKSGLKAKFIHERIISPKKFAKKSFRTKKLDGHSAIFACPKGKYSKGKCKVPVKLQSLLHPKVKNPVLETALGIGLGLTAGDIGRKMVSKAGFMKNKINVYPLKQIGPYIKELKSLGLTRPQIEKNLKQTFKMGGWDAKYYTTKFLFHKNMIQTKKKLISKAKKITDKFSSSDLIKLQKELSKNPIEGATKIYDDVLAIEAVKGDKSLWPNEKFRHDFKQTKGKASIYGLPDGSILIKGKKALWKNFNYDKNDI